MNVYPLSHRNCEITSGRSAPDLKVISSNIRRVHSDELSVVAVIQGHCDQHKLFQPFLILLT